MKTPAQDAVEMLGPHGEWGAMRRDQLLSLHSVQGSKAWESPAGLAGVTASLGWMAGHVDLGKSLLGKTGKLFPEGEMHSCSQTTTNTQCRDL